MGIYDRDYYRKGGPRYFDAFVKTGQVCKWLIIVNAVVFGLQLLSKPTPQPFGFRSEGVVTNWLVLDTHKVLQGQIWRLFTYAFLHSTGDFFHIVINMWLLWLLGKMVEERYGSREFLAFYLVAALVGGVAFQIIAMAGGPVGPCLGASGAVTAAMVLCAFNFPHHKVLLFFVLPIPIWLLVAFPVGRDLITFLQGADTRVAVSVHLAGAAFAAIYFKAEMRVTAGFDGFRSWFKRRRQPSLKIYREEELREPVRVAAPSEPVVDEQLEAKLDAVLEKVARSGQSSLTESEKEILMKASEIYQKRRN